MAEGSDGKFAWLKHSVPIWAAVIALGGGIVGALEQAQANIDLERKKLESSLIVTALQAPDSVEAARRLLFMIKTGLIKMSDDQLKQIRLVTIPTLGTGQPSPPILASLERQPLARNNHQHGNAHQATAGARPIPGRQAADAAVSQRMRSIRTEISPIGKSQPPGTSVEVRPDGSHIWRHPDGSMDVEWVGPLGPIVLSFGHVLASDKTLYDAKKFTENPDPSGPQARSLGPSLTQGLSGNRGYDNVERYNFTSNTQF